MLPYTRYAASSSILVQVSDYLPGRSYERFVSRQSPRVWERSVGAIIRVAERVSRVAAEVLAEPTTMAPVSLAEEVGAYTEMMRGSGMDSAYLNAIHRALTDVPPMAPILQHGDLWPGNVVHHRGTWRLIDFAEFGLVRVPMFDVFHMLRSNPWFSHELEAGWKTTERRVDPVWRFAAGRIVRSAGGRAGLDDRSTAAALIYYIVYMAIYRLRDGVSPEYREPFLREVRRLAEFLLAGHDAVDLLP